MVIAGFDVGTLPEEQRMRELAVEFKARRDRLSPDEVESYVRRFRTQKSALESRRDRFLRAFSPAA